ncbi:MAG: hypothetical protein ACREXY_15450, partial [Gammaproteobacteria bacterium]
SGYEPDELPGCSTPRHHLLPQAPALASASLAILPPCGRSGRPFGLAKLSLRDLDPVKKQKPPLGLAGSGF